MKSVEDIQLELARNPNDIPPGIVKEYLITLAVQQAYMGKAYAQAKQDAYKVKKALLDNDIKMTDARAETMMKASDAYRTYQEREREYEALVELIRVLKIVSKLNELESENAGQLGG